MDRGHSNLFQVYLRLRPAAPGGKTERFLAVEQPEEDIAPTHITLNPPNDRRRAIEKFGFTQVFEEDASQLDVFHCTGVAPLVEGVVAPHGGEGTDALIATLGVSGSGKTHTILGSKTQRGMTQLALDLLFRSIQSNVVDCFSSPSLESSINASDASEATLIAAQSFIDNVYGDPNAFRASSRAQTPMLVGETPAVTPTHPSTFSLYPTMRMLNPSSPTSIRMVQRPSPVSRHVLDNLENSFPSSPLDPHPPSKLMAKKTNSHFMSATHAARNKTKNAKTADEKGEHLAPQLTPRRFLQGPSMLPTQPDISGVSVSCDPSTEYVVLISMYEVYNDRIFDLLTPPVKMNATKELRRRPLLFKSTEQSPDRKVVAGLRKVVCSNLKEATMVLEAALHERRVAGTGSNSTSSRSHGFFCVEVKKRHKGRHTTPWSSTNLTIVDLAGSERAREAKTAGATLAEAGKINESLMYLGQCLQMQSDAGSNSSKVQHKQGPCLGHRDTSITNISPNKQPNVVPFRQCKLTELLFSNSFPSASLTQSTSSRRRNPQKGVMIVAADPHGDFNATSQILRYSALAREITVPRIPSITSTILAATAPPPQIPSSPPLPSSSPVLSHSRPFFPPGHPHPPITNALADEVNCTPIPGGFLDQHSARTFSPASETMEFAALEISRLHEELEDARLALAREREARVEAEAHLETFEASIEDRLLDLELAIRDQVAEEYEQRMGMELARMRSHFLIEQERGEEHMNRKIEALGRGLGAYDSDGDEGDEDKENVLVESLEEENGRLKREMEVLRREVDGTGKGKRGPLQERGCSGTGSGCRGSPKKERESTRGRQEKTQEGGGLAKKMAGLKVEDERVGSVGSVSSVRSGSPVKKSSRRVQQREV